MKKYLVVAVTLLVCCGMALAAHAQDAGTVVVNVPFEFMAGSQTLPAGTYTIRRAFAETSSALLISGGGTHGLFVLPAAFDSAAPELKTRPRVWAHGASEIDRIEHAIEQFSGASLTTAERRGRRVSFFSPEKVKSILRRLAPRAAGSRRRPISPASGLRSGPLSADLERS